MVFLYSVLSLLTISPLFAYIIEGYDQKNTKRGVKFVLVFLALAFISILLLMQFKLYFVLSIPIILISFIIVSKKAN